MATLDAQSLIDAVTPTDKTPGGFTMAGNALSRGQITSNLGTVQDRLTQDLNNWTLPGIADSQAARGATFSTATARKNTQAKQSYLRQYGDVGNQAAYSLAGLGLSDIGASIPGVSF